MCAGFSREKCPYQKVLSAHCRRSLILVLKRLLLLPVPLQRVYPSAWILAPEYATEMGGTAPIGEDAWLRAGSEVKMMVALMLKIK